MSISSNGKPLAAKYFATDNPVLPNPIMMLLGLVLHPHGLAQIPIDVRVGEVQCGRGVVAEHPGEDGVLG